MNDLEQLLRTELDDVHESLSAPYVDVAGLAALGRRERRRRTGITTGLVAAVAVVATTVGLVVVPDSGAPVEVAGPTSEAVPTGLDDLPEGGPSTAPWSAGRVLHAGRTTYAFGQDAHRTHYAGGTTVAVLKRDGEWRALVLVDGVARTLAADPGQDPPFELLPSADGRWVALAFRIDRTTVNVYLHDTTGEAQDQLHQFTGPGVRVSFSLLNVTNDGRVVISDDAFRVWTPGSDPVVVDGLETVSDDAISYPGGIATARRGNAPGGTYGTISAAGRFQALGDLDADPVSWSPTGVQWVYADSGDLLVTGVDDETADVLRLPPIESDWAVLGWESETQVVVRGTTSDGVDTQARCDVVSQGCERVPLGG